MSSSCVHTAHRDSVDCGGGDGSHDPALHTSLPSMPKAQSASVAVSVSISSLSQSVAHHCLVVILCQPQPYHYLVPNTPCYRHAPSTYHQRHSLLSSYTIHITTMTTYIHTFVHRFNLVASRVVSSHADVQWCSGAVWLIFSSHVTTPRSYHIAPLHFKHETRRDDKQANRVWCGRGAR